MTNNCGCLTLCSCSPDFCTEDGQLQPFWMRVQEQAVESYTMKEVFDMDSSVRVEAIENLGETTASTPRCLV